MWGQEEKEEVRILFILTSRAPQGRPERHVASHGLVGVSIMRIPDEKVEEVRAASDIMDVVGEYVRLKKRGANYFGLCPFHNEKSPSFSVNPRLGIFKCFGCQEGGDVFTFVSKVENLGFTETVRMLAERAGIPLPVEEGPQEDQTEIESIYHALRFAGRFFFEQLTQTDAGKPALAYLEDRGFSPKTIKQFGLGFAPESWDALLRAAEVHHFEPAILEKAGLVLSRKQGDGYYDRFRGRVVFPIFSHVGRVLGFGGRILTSATDHPKYINSPETKVYFKSRVLYGLYQSKQAIRKSEEVLLVEGYTDVISLHQAGVQNVVASSGTALTNEQVKVLGRYAKRILLLYDADNAGLEAALRGINLVLAQGLSVYAIALPKGEDPDSFVRKHGGAEFGAYARKHRQDFIAFTYAAARRAGRLDTPEGEATTMHHVMESIAQIPDPLMQETFLRRASEVMGVPDIRLHQALATHVKDQRPRGQEFGPTPELPPLEAYGDDVNTEADEEASNWADPLPEEKNLLRLMLEHGRSMVELILGNMALDEFTEGPARTMAKSFLSMYQQGEVETHPFLEGTYGEAVQRLAAEVMVDRYTPSDNWKERKIAVPRLNEHPEEAAISAMTLLKLDRVQEAIEQQKQKIFHAAQNNSPDLRSLQEGMMALHQLHKHITQRAFLDDSRG